MKTEAIDIDISAIAVKHSPRRELGDLATLTASIKKLGVIEPLLVDAHNVLISGHRRLAAARQAGLALVPARRIDVSADSMTALDMQTDLNLCRTPLDTDDADRLIERKKARLAAAPEGERGFLDRLRRVVRPGGSED